MKRKVTALRSGRFTLILRMLCVVAMMTAGLTHGPKPSFAALPDMAAYTLPDGSVPVLCLPSDEGGTRSQGRHDATCLGCLFAASFIPVPYIIGSVWLAPVAGNAALPWRDDIPPPTVLSPNAKPRAPPHR